MRITNPNKYFLIEDHHQALKIWRKLKVRGLNLVHIDAHIDFGFHVAKPFKQAIAEARTLKDLKRSLELSLAFRRREKNFDSQTNIGNYIYPAILEGMVKDFYWVIPGKAMDFDESRRLLKEILRNLLKSDPGGEKNNSANFSNLNGSIVSSLMGRKFVITTLEGLPVFKDRVLLDIDTDFLMVDKLKDAEATSLIGRRRPWIKPKDFVNALRAKITNPEVTTIAYSVNGGFTPMRYKHLADEIAFCLYPGMHKDRYRKLSQAADNFSKFLLSKKALLYHRAIKLNPTYRVSDNNYGNLYLAKRMLSRAEKEFQGIAKIDLHNPRPLIGLGRVALLKKDYRRARNFFARALRKAKHDFMATAGLAEAEFRLHRYEKSQMLFLRVQKKDRLDPFSCYFLGCIAYHKHDFESAARFYKNALMLGFDDTKVFKRLLKIAKKVKDRKGIIKLSKIKLKRLNASLKFVKGEKEKRIKRSINELRKLLDGNLKD